MYRTGVVWRAALAAFLVGEGLTQTEAAHLLGRSPATISALLKRVREDAEQLIQLHDEGLGVATQTNRLGIGEENVEGVTM